MDKVNINLGNCTLTMVHIPGLGKLPDFYVSETPITIEEYKDLSPKDGAEGSVSSSVSVLSDGERCLLQAHVIA